jgi:hypothetical protein
MSLYNVMGVVTTASVGFFEGCTSKTVEQEKAKVAMSGAALYDAIDQALKASPELEPKKPCDYTDPINDKNKLKALSTELASAIVKGNRVPASQAGTTDATNAAALTDSQKNWAIDQIAKLLSEGKKDEAGKVVYEPIVKAGVTVRALLPSVWSKARLMIGCGIKEIFPDAVMLNVNASDIEEIMKAAAQQPAGGGGSANIISTIKIIGSPLPGADKQPTAGKEFEYAAFRLNLGAKVPAGFNNQCKIDAVSADNAAAGSLPVTIEEVPAGPTIAYPAAVTKDGERAEAFLYGMKPEGKAKIATAGTYTINLTCDGLDPINLGSLTVKAASMVVIPPVVIPPVVIPPVAIPPVVIPPGRHRGGSNAAQ